MKTNRPAKAPPWRLRGGNVTTKKKNRKYIVEVHSTPLSVSVRASDPATAASAALRAFGRALREAHVKDALASEVAVELDHGDGPLRQQLLSGAEVARRIGVSRQRVSQLAATSHFPKPLSNVGGYLVWRWGDIA